MSNSIPICTESIAAYKTIMTKPAEHGMWFRPLEECFEKSDTVTPNHLLAKAYMENENHMCPKLVLYIIMNEIYGLCRYKAESGELGYYLKFKPKDVPACTE